MFPGSRAEVEPERGIPSDSAATVRPARSPKRKNEFKQKLCPSFPSELHVGPVSYCRRPHIPATAQKRIDFTEFQCTILQNPTFLRPRPMRAPGPAAAATESIAALGRSSSTPSLRPASRNKAEKPVIPSRGRGAKALNGSDRNPEKTNFPGPREKDDIFSCHAGNEFPHDRKIPDRFPRVASAVPERRRRSAHFPSADRDRRCSILSSSRYDVFGDAMDRRGDRFGRSSRECSGEKKPEFAAEATSALDKPPVGNL